MNKKAKPVCYSYLKRSVIGEREKHLVVLRQEPYEPETFVVLVVAVYDDSRGFKMKTVKDLPLAGQSMMISNIVIKVVLNLYFTNSVLNFCKYSSILPTIRYILIFGDSYSEKICTAKTKGN